MRFVRVPPREGALWVRRAFQIFFRQPLGFASLFAACALVFFLLPRLPIVGEPMLLLVVPIGSLLFMIATRLAVAGGRPVPGAFVELAATDRPRFLRLLKLCLAYLVAAAISIGIIAAVDGDAMAAFLDAAAKPQASPDEIAALLADSRVQAGFLARFVLGLLLSIPFWHAPGLVYWGAQSWAKALFFSSMAIWRNKGAFAVYGLVWIGLGGVMLMLLSLLIALSSAEQATYIATPMVLLFTTVLYVSLWFTFAACFAEEDGRGALLASA